jgi:hypothetical protein
MLPRGAPEAWPMNRGREALGMADRWLGWTSEGSRADIRRALMSLRPKATLAFASSAEDLRERVMDSAETPWGVIVGLSESGVSDMNLAAAVAHDGMAGSVVLVTRNASGSLRSRAAQAGIDTVIDMGRSMPRSRWLAKRGARGAFGQTMPPRPRRKGPSRRAIQMAFRSLWTSPMVSPGARWAWHLPALRKGAVGRCSCSSLGGAAWARPPSRRSVPSWRARGA